MRVGLLIPLRCLDMKVKSAIENPINKINCESLRQWKLLPRLCISTLPLLREMWLRANMQSESSSRISGVCVLFVYLVFTKGTHYITKVTTVCLKWAGAVVW